MSGPSVSGTVLPRATSVVLVVAIAFALWRLGPVLVAVFGGVVFAVAVKNRLNSGRTQQAK